MRTLPLILGTGGIMACCFAMSPHELCERPPLANGGLFWQVTLSRWTLGIGKQQSGSEGCARC